MNTDKFKQAEHLRQAALDYINAHPHSTAPDIIAALGWGRVAGASRLDAMSQMGELYRVPKVAERKNACGITQSLHTYAYVARVRVTVTAEAMIERIREARRSGKRGQKKQRIVPGKWCNGVFRNTKDDRDCIPNQGGQGAARPRHFSSLEYVA